MTAKLMKSQSQKVLLEKSKTDQRLETLYEEEVNLSGVKGADSDKNQQTENDSFQKMLDEYDKERKAITRQVRQLSHMSTFQQTPNRNIPHMGDFK